MNISLPSSDSEIEVYFLNDGIGEDSLYNRSSKDEEGENWSWKMVICIKFYIAFIVIMGIVGNILIGAVFSCTPLKHKPSSYFLSSLAIADSCFLINIFVYYFSVFPPDSGGKVIPFCRFHNYVSKVSSNCSVWYTVGYTIERYIAVMYPTRLASLRTRKRTKIAIYALVISSVVLYLYIFVTFKENCKSTGKGVVIYNIVFLLIEYILSFVGPIFIIFPINFLIIIQLLRLNPLQNSFGDSGLTKTLSFQARSLSSMVNPTDELKNSKTMKPSKIVENPLSTDKEEQIPVIQIQTENKQNHINSEPQKEDEEGPEPKTILANGFHSTYKNQLLVTSQSCPMKLQTKTFEIKKFSVQESFRIDIIHSKSKDIEVNTPTIPNKKPKFTVKNLSPKFSNSSSNSSSGPEREYFSTNEDQIEYQEKQAKIINCNDQLLQTDFPSVSDPEDASPCKTPESSKVITNVPNFDSPVSSSDISSKLETSSPVSTKDPEILLNSQQTNKLNCRTPPNVSQSSYTDINQVTIDIDRWQKKPRRPASPFYKLMGKKRHIKTPHHENGTLAQTRSLSLRSSCSISSIGSQSRYSSTINHSISSYRSVGSSIIACEDSLRSKPGICLRIKQCSSTTVMLLITSSVFLILHLPSVVLRAYFHFRGKISEPENMMFILAIFDLLDFLHYAINFFLYCFSGSTFRNHTKVLFKQYFK